jgi:hypothetical protein
MKDMAASFRGGMRNTAALLNRGILSNTASSFRTEIRSTVAAHFKRSEDYGSFPQQGE